MIDFQKPFLYLTVKIGKRTGDSDGTDDVMFVNNTMHSLFSNCEVFFNNEQVYTSNGLYPHKAFVPNEFSGTKGTKESISFCQGYDYENDPSAFGEEPFVTRKGKKTDNVAFTGSYVLIFSLVTSFYFLMLMYSYDWFVRDRFSI